jgi:hypothetical protein
MASAGRARGDLGEHDAPGGVQLPDTPPLLHYARRQDVLAWSLDALR